MIRQWIQRLSAPSLVASLIACGAGGGGEFENIEQTVVGTCGSCHDVQGFEALLADIRALPDDAFTAERIPDTMFTLNDRQKSTADLIEAANPPRDATIDPATPDRKAWILSQMHELEVQLSSVPSSDFTDQEGFETYNGFGDVIPQGCETLSRLELDDPEDPTQMPPPWTEPLFESVGKTFVRLTPDDRAALMDSVTASLAGGGGTCF